VQHPQQSCIFTFVVSTPAACPAPPPPPACRWESQGYSYDLAPLMGKDLSVLDSYGTSHYLSVCGVLSSAAAAPCTALDASASACEITSSGSTVDVGNWPSDSSAVRWSFIDPSVPATGISYVLNGGTCPATPGANFATIVKFLCSQRTSPLRVELISQCTVGYTMETPLACLSGPPVPPKVCTWNGYDLSSLMGTDLQGSDGVTAATYAVSVCSPLRPGNTSISAACLMVDKLTSACTSEAGAQAVDLGNWDTSRAAPQPQWGYINAKAPAVGIQYTLVSSAGCRPARGEPVPYTSVVQFLCAREQSSAVQVDFPNGACTAVFSLYTPLACPPAV